MPRGALSSHRACRLFEAIASFAIAAGEELAAAAPLPVPEQRGLFVGHGGLRVGWKDLWPAMQDQSSDATGAWARGLGRMHPLWMLRFLSNNVHAVLAQAIGTEGEGAVCSGPSAGVEALATAQLALAAGAIDVAWVVLYDDRTVGEVALARAVVGDLRPGAACALALRLERARDGYRRLDAQVQAFTPAAPTQRLPSTIDLGIVAPVLAAVMAAPGTSATLAWPDALGSTASIHVMDPLAKDIAP